MPKEIEQKIAKEYFVDKVTANIICNRYHIRTKTLQMILGKYKDQYQE